MVMDMKNPVNEQKMMVEMIPLFHSPLASLIFYRSTLVKASSARACVSSILVYTRLHVHSQHGLVPS